MSADHRHDEPKGKGFVVTVAIAGALCGFAAVWMYVVKARTEVDEATRAVALKSAEQLRSAQEQMWASAPMIDIGSADPRELRAWMKDAVKPSANLPEDAAQALAATVASHVIARASTDPDDYLMLADAEGTRWSPPTQQAAWEAIRLRYEFVAKKPADPSDPRGVLRTLIEAGHRLEGSRYTKVAMDGPARRIEVRLVRTVDEADASQFGTVDDYQYWFGAPSHNAYRLRTPARSLQDVLSAHGSTWYAEVRLIVETERGSRVGWLSEWYWDPQSRQWCNRRMTLHTWPPHGTFY